MTCNIGTKHIPMKCVFSPPPVTQPICSLQLLLSSRISLFSPSCSICLSPWLTSVLPLFFNMLNERFRVEAWQECGSTFPFSERGQGQITPSRVYFAPTLRSRDSYVKDSGCCLHLGVSACVCRKKDDISVAQCVLKSPQPLWCMLLICTGEDDHCEGLIKAKLLQYNLIIMDYYQGAVVLTFARVIIGCV